jgi:glyoxylase-like metal-dependent hydrolase (beta-lactamase superfamily II)
MTLLPSWATPISLPMPATRGAVNVYLVRGPDGAALVDTGMNDAASRAALVAALSENGLCLGDLGAVVCTHYHVDHCGLGATLLEAGAEVMMSARDAASLEIFFGDPGLDARRATFFDRHRVPAEFESRVTPMFPFLRSLQERFTPTRMLAEGDVVSLGGVRFDVLLVPGHTQGHLCLLEPSSGVLLTGDHVIPGKISQVSLREESMGTDPIGAFFDSLERVRALGPRLGLGGHGAPLDDVAARIAEVVRHHRERLEGVVAALSREPRSAYDIARAVFGERRQPFAMWLAMSQALAYLEHLGREGRAAEIDTGDGLAFALPTGAPTG